MKNHVTLDDVREQLGDARKDMEIAAVSAVRVLKFLEEEVKLKPRQAMLTAAISYLAICDMIGLDHDETRTLIVSLLRVSEQHASDQTTH